MVPPTPLPRPTLLARWWRSRIGYRFLVEASVMVGLFFVYKVIRFSVRGDATDAFANARHVIRFEKATWIFTEPDFQRLLLHYPGLVRLLNRYYVGMHFPTTILCLAWLYVWRPRAYLSTRRVLVILTAGGMLIHVLYPLAPPRMLPGFGFVDTGALLGPAAYGHGAPFDGLANQFAAMPSLHFGWAVVIAIAIIRNARTRWRWLIVLHPIATTAAIVGTANHYWMDAIVAGLLLGLVYAALGLWHRIRRAGHRDTFDRDETPQEPKAANRRDDVRIVDLRVPGQVASAG
jgi:hypothetical protein